MFKRIFKRICDRFSPVLDEFSLGNFLRVCTKHKHLWKQKGSAVLEASLCIPILLCLTFFTLEAIRIGICQIAVDNMALKLAFEFSGLKSSTNFSKVIEDSKPAFLKSMDNIHCRISVFSDLNTLMESNKNSVTEDPPWTSNSLISIRYPDGLVSEPTSGCAFVVTVACKFSFSSAFIKKLFAGGTNYGNNFLLWGRAINVCS